MRDCPLYIAKLSDFVLFINFRTDLTFDTKKVLTHALMKDCCYLVAKITVLTALILWCQQTASTRYLHGMRQDYWKIFCTYNFFECCIVLF